MLRKIAMLVAGVCCFAGILVAQPTIQISNATANQGETVTISLTVDNYTDYISLEFILTWNPDILLYQSVDNLTSGLPGFTEASSINLSQNGMLNVSWFESNITPTTLPNGTTLFEVTFQVTGDPCDSTGLTLASVEIADADENNVGATVEPGYVNVPGTDCGSFNGVQIIGETKTVGPGSSVCIQFKSQGFNNVVAASYTITFNPSVLQYTGIQNINWPDFAAGTTFSDAEAASGILRVVWTDPNALGIDIADGTVLYELCFQAIGSGGQMSQIGFSDTPVAIEFADGNSDPLEFQGVPGKVIIEGEIQGFALSFPNIEAGPGDEVCLPITVNDFTDIIALQGSFNWDSTVLEFVRFEGFNLPDLESSVAGPEAPANNAGQAVMAWIDNNLQGITLPNGSELMRICFNVIGQCDQSSDVTFSSTPTDVEFADINDQITSYTLVDGSVTINCNGCGANVVNVLDVCPGASTGGIDIELLGSCMQPVSYLWSNGDTTEDLTNVPPGKYVVTITTGSQFIILDTITITTLNPVQVDAGIQDANNNDGAINITVVGGEPPYSFSWSNGDTVQNIFNLAPGQYSVTITDANGCTYVAGPYTVNDANAASADVTNACGGECTGVISVTTVNCADPPYTYQWSSGETTAMITDLCAGTYTVTVTGSGGASCTAAFTVLQSASPITVTVDTMNETSAGNDGEIHVMVSGGQPPYSYQWDNSLPPGPDQTGLTVGEYTVTVTDQLGCEVVEIILLRGKALFVDAVGSSFNGYGVSCSDACDGEILALPGNVVGTPSYLWSNGSTNQIITDICAGTYGVTVTDQLGATAAAVYTLTAPPALLAQISVTCASAPGVPDGIASASVSGGVMPYSYSWTNGESSSTIQDVPPGPYTLSVTDENGCELDQRFDVCIEGIDCYQAITVITPNGDGKNDWFTINCVYDYPNILSIYNRYGGLEFEMENYDNSWQGTDQEGNVLSDGGYHWVLQVMQNGQRLIYQGTVSVIRSLD